MSKEVTICWFRRNLRIEDNTSFYHALKSGFPVIPVFIFDKEILSTLSTIEDRRVDFIYRTLKHLNEKFQNHGSSFFIVHDKPLDAFKEICEKFSVKEVHTDHDYEPYAKERDEAVRKFLNNKGIKFFTYKDQVIFEREEVLKDDGNPYHVYTPYSKKWKEKFSKADVTNRYSVRNLSHLFQKDNFRFPTLEAIGFRSTDIQFPELQISDAALKKYDQVRNFPALEATSHVSLYLRFGTISIRHLVQLARENNDIYLNELIWREFFMMILDHYPRVVSENFNKKYDGIRWRNNENEFRKWCNGETGFPLVDAGMRQLNQTGYMHNRVRLVVSGFLTKDLLIDWRWGEAYFAEKLLDYELSSNNGNWQWAAGTGCDAAPYFRIFNPDEQAKKFDPESIYIQKWIPDLNDYPPPMVDHAMARKRALEVYKKAVAN